MTGEATGESPYCDWIDEGHWDLLPRLFDVGKDTVDSAARDDATSLDKRTARFDAKRDIMDNSFLLVLKSNL